MLTWKQQIEVIETMIDIYRYQEYTLHVCLKIALAKLGYKCGIWEIIFYRNKYAQRFGATKMHYTIQFRYNWFFNKTQKEHDFLNWMLEETKSEYARSKFNTNKQVQANDPNDLNN